MPNPSLIIGLGGTGTLVCTYVKKDLMELSGGSWPPPGVRILSFDTDKKQPDLGRHGKIRQAGETTGAVQLETGEFNFIGGNIEGLAREVAKGLHPHLRSWFLAEFYLRDAKLSPTLYNLNDGAGQFRQFGRMAVFRDVAIPATSKLFNSIHSAMTKIKQEHPNPTSFQVFLVSSLAGGTGAGMFVDTAYLIRKIAEIPEINLAGLMKFRGYLVLPDAFGNTLPDQSWLPAMHARAFAAMRESSRFTVSFDYEQGYPMHYHSTGEHPIWRGSMKTKLFDLLYYIDGQGKRNQLNVVDLKSGVGPMIADAISAIIDEKAGDAFATYVANIEAERTTRITDNTLSKSTSTFGSVGTYTISLPIHGMLEGWTHDLGLEALGALVSPEAVEPGSNHPDKLKTNANLESRGVDGFGAAREFLKANKAVSYEYREGGETKPLSVEPTLLLAELGKIAERSRRDRRAAVIDLANRRIEDWKPHFMPSGEDNETQALLRQVELIMAMHLYARTGTGQVQATDQIKPRPKKIDFETEAERIGDETRIFKNRRLGDEDPKTGQRSGGQYRSKLEIIRAFHTDRFDKCINYYIQGTLNGRVNIPALQAKSGKLGFLTAFLAGLIEDLAEVEGVLKDAQVQRSKKESNRKIAEADAAISRQELKNLSARGGKRAEEAQDKYLEIESSLVDFLESEAVEESILDAVIDMLDYLRAALGEVNSWQKTLALSADSLYAALVDGRKQVNSDKNADKDIKSRMVVHDLEYEKQRYDYYMRSGTALEAVLDKLSWKMQTKVEEGREKLVGLKLSIDQEEGQTDLSPQPEQTNLLTWLKLCRRPFLTGLQEESIIRYLTGHSDYSDPNKLAETIHQFSSVALKVDGGNPLRANFLRAFFQDADEAKYRQYLGQVIQQLAQLNGVAALESGPASGANESKYGKFLNSEDRFKFTFIFTEELIELTNIDAYNKVGRGQYIGGEGRIAKGDRRMLHVFPAEVHAAEYEGRLPELKQEIRLFSDDVVLQLEDLERFRLFMMCYGYDMVRPTTVQVGASGTSKQVWALHLPPIDMTVEGEAAEWEPIYLTDPDKKGSIHDALMTFNYVRFEVGRGTVVPIVISRVSETLIRKRKEDATERYQANKAGEGTPLRAMVDKITNETTRNSYLLELARVDRIRVTFSNLTQRILPGLKAELTNGNDHEKQKEYDIYSIFALMLSDELRVVTENVRAAAGNLQAF